MAITPRMIFDPAALESEDARPLVLLDVDGVLIPSPYREAQHEGETTIHMAPIGANQPVQLVDASGSRTLREQMGGMTACFAAGIADMLKDIDQRARMVWATSWEQMAHDELAPVLGCGHDWPYMVMRGSHQSSKWPLVQQVPDHVALVWIDDSAIPPSANRWAAQRSGPTLLIRPDPATGLSITQQKRVIAFIEEHSHA